MIIKLLSVYTAMEIFVGSRVAGKTKSLADIETLLKMDKKYDNVIGTDVSDAEVSKKAVNILGQSKKS